MSRRSSRRVTEYLGDPVIVREFVMSGCEGKQAFESAQMASMVARKRSKKSEHYRCKFCGLFHIYTVGKKRR